MFVTSRLLELLAPEELDTVRAHELTHLRNRDALVLSLSRSSGLAVAALSAAAILARAAVATGELAQLTARLTSWLLPSSASEKQVGYFRGCLGLNVATLALSFGSYALGALLGVGV